MLYVFMMGLITHDIVIPVEIRKLTQIVYVTVPSVAVNKFWFDPVIIIFSFGK